MKSAALQRRRPGQRTMVVILAGLALACIVPVQGQVAAAPAQVAERVRALKVKVRDLAAAQQYQAAAPLVDELMSLDRAQPFPPARDLARDLITIASTLVPGEDYQRVEYVFRRGIQLLEGSPDTRPGDVFVALNNLSALYYRMGNSAGWDQTISRIVNMAEKLQADVDEDTAMVLLEVARVLSESKQYKPVVMLYGRVHPYLLKRFRDAPAERGAWLTRYADVLAADAQYKEALDLYGQALALRDPSRAPDATELSLRARMGSVALHRGDLPAAEQVLDRGRRDAQQAGLGDTETAGTIYHNLAVTYLRQNRSEKYGDAEALLRHCLEIEGRMAHRTSVSFAQTLNQLAVVLGLASKFAEAERSYTDAISVFEVLPEPAPAEFAVCLRDFASVLLQQQRPADAVKHLSRAVTLLDSIGDQDRQQIANAVSELAAAQFKAGNLEQASREYWRAITMRQSSPASTR
jgi:tetratricopeptide (TPR) repeat protein